ncbi:hypothetical protein Tco_1549711 [Tanacetum coccineum]
MLSVFTKMNYGIAERHHVPSDALHNSSQPFKFPSNDSCLIYHGDQHDFCWVLEDFTAYCCWFNIGVASEDLVLLRKIEENRLKRFLLRKSFDTLVDHLQEVMVESLPTTVDTHIKEQVKKQVPEKVRDQALVYVAEGLILERQKTKEEMERMIAKAILQERGNIQAEISLQIQKLLIIRSLLKLTR